VSVSDGDEVNRGVPLIAVAAALSFASGAMDITSFTRLGMVFSSVMTGNLVLFGLAAERASGELALHTAVAIGSYVLGVALGSLVGRDAGSPHALWPPRVTAILIVESVVFAGFTIGWELSSGHPAGNSQYFLLAAAALAMGLQSEAVRKVGTRLSTTYLTGALTATVASFVTRTKGVRNDLNLAVLASAAAGAAAGGALIRLVPAALPVLPVVAVVGVVAAVATVGVRE
jgi:uncharacterized membrane protein YoaK (UPF0700 family)